MYDAVGPVQPVPVLSVLNTNETAQAEELVKEVLQAAAGLLSPPPPFGSAPVPSPSYGDGNYPGVCAAPGMFCQRFCCFSLFLLPLPPAPSSYGDGNYPGVCAAAGKFVCAAQALSLCCRGAAPPCVWWSEFLV